MIKKISYLLILLWTTHFCYGQRTIPNPIILVHGWTGNGYTNDNKGTWTEFTNYLQEKANLTIERNPLSYNLNCDNNIYSSNKYNDVCDNNYGTLGNKDIYIINFDTRTGNQSNQAGVVKQGYALKFAIQKVLNVTGADKVILLGHSMGGLAIREYLQNSSNWQSDGEHHIAKLATIGTPHRGSDTSLGFLTNILIGKDENSESVRDLRDSYFYSNCTRDGQPIKCPGVYLWGGQESRTWMRTNALGGSSFYNIDVNCNGSTGDNVIGLNQKSLYLNLDFACIIGGPTFSDGIVSIESQNLNTVYPNISETFYWNCNKSTGIICHTQEPKQAFIEMIQALDEPKTYLTKINFGNQYKGFFTLQANSNQIDVDEYSLTVSQKGLVSFIANQVDASNARLTLKKTNGEVIYSEYLSSGLTNKVIVEPGNYIVSFSGNSLGSWATYNFSLGICNLPTELKIFTDQNTVFCSGDSIKINSTSGYQNYEWLNDNNSVVKNYNTIYAKTSGNYSVKAKSCGLTFSSNAITTLVKKKPAIPNLNLEVYPDSFMIFSSSKNNHIWYFNNEKKENLNTSSFSPDKLGDYFAVVDSLGCSSKSEIISVLIEKPLIKLIGSTTICEGEEVKIELPKGFGKYELFSESNSIVQTSNIFNLSKTGNYIATTFRGKLESPASDAITVTVNPNPESPLITYKDGYLFSSSDLNNQWYLDNLVLKDSTKNKLKIDGFGNYTVKVELNGCYAASSFYLVTSTELEIQNKKYNVYPNPTNGEFWIENLGQNEWLTIRIYDVKGEVLYYSRLSKNLNTKQINLELNPGLYILQIQDKKGISTLKLIRQ